MDPLSVAASVAGLLQIGAKVIGFLSTAVDAPSTARAVLAEVNALHGIFRQLEEFIVHFAEHSTARKSRIYVEDLIIALTGCVCAFSELDKELEGLKADDGDGDGPRSKFGAWDSVKWAAKDQDIAKILRNLQMHKTSLSLLLSVYTCTSMQQMQQENAELKHNLAEVLRVIPALAERLEAARSSENNDDVSSIRSKTSILSTEPKRCSRRFTIAFEQTLVETRVYKKAYKNSSSSSCMTIGTTDSRWSQLTGLSMAQISNISVICLPVYISELNNGYIYPHGQGESYDKLASRRIPVEQFQRQRDGDVGIGHLLTPLRQQISLLHAAARKGDNAAVEALVKVVGGLIDSWDDNGYTALQCAVISEHIGTVQLLLNHGAEIEAKTKDGLTTLHTAVEAGRTDMVQLLLDLGADIEGKAKNSLTTLHIAVWAGRTDVVQLLLDRGANTEAKDDLRWTPLHRAVTRGYTAIVRQLLGRGADTEPKDVAGWTPLHQATRRGRTAIVQQLLDRGADIEAKVVNGWTPLHRAAWDSNADMVQLLLDRCANIEAKDNSGWTPLHQAATRGYTVIMQQLLDRGANTNAKDDLGWTPLHRAVSSGHTITVQLLLDYGAYTEAQGSGCGTALQVADEKSLEDLTQLLGRGEQIRCRANTAQS